MSDLCPCPHPDVVIEGETVFCAYCGGDISMVDFEAAAVALHGDPLDDVSDALLCARFETSL